nr:L-rhamnose mutarotase [Aquisalinus flavus]
MQLLPGNVEEYRKRHDEIWPQLSKLLSESGIYDYSIFLDRQSLTLFACMKLAPGHSLASLPDHPVMRQWWEYMAPLMETAPTNEPVTHDLDQVFYMK